MKLRQLKPKLYILQLAFTATAACFYLVLLGHHIGIYDNFTIPGRKTEKRDKIDPGSFAVYRKFFIKVREASYFTCKFSYFNFPPHAH